jgi:hypothetical protein
MISYGRSTTPMDYTSVPPLTMSSTKLILVRATIPISLKVYSKGGFGGHFPTKARIVIFAGLNSKSTASSKSRQDLIIRSKGFMQNT